MATFLELCQSAARESGTVSGDASPATVVGQTGRLKLIVGWVAAAWLDIQRSRPDWKWMVGEISAGTPVTVAGQRAYAPVTDFALPRYERLVFSRDDGDSALDIYPQAEGRARMSPLHYREWQDFRRRNLRGEATQGFPGYFSIGPDGKLYLDHVPDGVYVLDGEYRKTPQVLAANADVPEMPERFHDLIWQLALMYVSAYDENQSVQPQMWLQRRLVGYTALVRSEAPDIEMPWAWV